MSDIEGKLLALLNGEHSSLSLSFNELNGPNYQTVAECADDERACFDWASPEERERAIATNRMWMLQWYPDTPVGSHCIAASSIDAIFQWLEATDSAGH